MIGEILCKKAFSILIATDSIKRGIPGNELSIKTFLSHLSSARYSHDTAFAEYIQICDTVTAVGTNLSLRQAWEGPSISAGMNSFAVQLAEGLIGTI